jgi:hypothetical protein
MPIEKPFVIAFVAKVNVNPDYPLKDNESQNCVEKPSRMLIPDSPEPSLNIVVRKSEIM